MLLIFYLDLNLFQKLVHVELTHKKISLEAYVVYYCKTHHQVLSFALSVRKLPKANVKKKLKTYFKD